MQYESRVEYVSESTPGVSFTVSRMSLGRRIELAKMLREIGLQGAFHAAGKGIEDQIEASIAHHEIDRIYLRWGLMEVKGLTIDGAPADPAAVVERGPEPLVAEILTAIREQTTISKEERKN